MTDYERDMAAGGRPVMSDYDRDMAAGGKPVQAAAPQADPFAGPSHNIPMGVAAPEPEPESRLDKFLGATKRGLGAVGTMATDALDAASLGLYSKGRNAIVGAISPNEANAMQETEGQFRQEHPYVSGAARGLGYFLPGGAPARLAEAASAGIKGATAALPPLAARIATSRPVAGALTGAVVGGGTAAAEDVTAGAPAGDVLRDTGRAALVGAGLGAAGGSIAAGAEQLRGKLRNPKTEIGRTLATLDEAKASGVTKTPEFKARPHGAEGFNEEATVAEERLAGHNSHVLSKARADYGKTLETVLAEHGDRHHIVSETDATLNALSEDNTINGQTVDDHLAKALDKVRRMITVDTGEVDASAARTNVEAIANGEADVPNVMAPAVKVGDLMKVKRAVSKLADYGAPATPETRPYRVLDKALGRDLEGVDPRVTELNKSYAETMGKLEEANDVLYGSQNPDVVRSTAKQKRARGLLGRVGDNTQAATLARADLERLKAIDPEYGKIIAPVEARKAQARAGFGLPHVSRRIEHLPFAFAQQNATALGVHVADPILGALSGGNATGRSANPILRVNEERRRRDSERSAAFGGR